MFCPFHSLFSFQSPDNANIDVLDFGTCLLRYLHLFSFLFLFATLIWWIPHPLSSLNLSSASSSLLLNYSSVFFHFTYCIFQFHDFCLRFSHIFRLFVEVFILFIILIWSPVSIFMTITLNSLSGKLLISILLSFLPPWGFTLFFCLKHSPLYTDLTWRDRKRYSM